ncbi:hypothetical protein WN944_009082 [Citrus x changshan-huyou]|uniref:V-type proton ATPase subunit S1/VOA1 transmembrane domain-containing protein n=1 Tax=Citrus x changshan-huyou TaxID=2935761 RepID=A0AAP0MR36_9ROSI
MKNSYLVIRLLLLEVLSAIAFASPSTVPAFLWSTHHQKISSNDALNYQTLSPKDLAKAVLTQGGWADLLCSGRQSPQSVDVALVFVGRELQSSHISGNKHPDLALVDTLKVSFTKSNFSMAFPYIVSAGEETMESSLFSEFTEACVDDFKVANVAFSESCTVEGENFLKLADLHSVHDHLRLRAEKSLKGQADLIVVCYGDTQSMKQPKQPRPEILYVSDPVRSVQYPSHQELERFLAESVAGNKSTNNTGCDEVCQFKSSLFEGILVGIVLLLILVSGLCCMMGIDTPTRFEAPQES